MIRPTAFSTATAAALLALSGCASIFNGTTQTVGIQSTPPGASVRVVDAAGQTVHSGVTPMQVVLPRGAGYFRPGSYKVRYALDGHDPAEAPLDGRMSAWYMGNIVIGGLIGMLVIDPLTGGMYAYPDTVASTLAARPAAAAAAAPAGPTLAPTAPIAPMAIPVSTAAPTAAPAAAPGPAAPPAAPLAPAPTAAATPAARGLPSGTSSYEAERLPESRACAETARATLVAKGPGFETYAIACRNGDALAIRCEFGSCRVLR